MTKHGGTFKLSGETRDLLRKNKDFFEQISALNGDEGSDKVPLNIMGKDPEARTETKVQPNGDVEVSFVYPLDNDADPENGRLYLRDTFLFDSSEQKLKSFKRDAESNNKGSGNWAAWLEKYKTAIAAAPLKVEDEKVQQFAKTVARTFGRPITDESGATFPEIREVWVKDASYITAANALVLKQRENDPKLPEVKLKVKDKLNSFTLVPREDTYEVVFNFAVDGDDDAANGRILMKDKFILDAKTLAFKELQRSWELAPESAGHAEYQAYVDKLKTEEAPKQEQAEAFLKGMLPVLLSGTELDAAQGLPNLTKPLDLPKDYRSPLARRFEAEKKGLAATPEGATQALETMQVVAFDGLSQRHDASLGWWNRKVKGNAPVDLNAETALVQSIFKKAAEASKATPTVSAFAALSGLKLEGREAALRERLLADPMMAKIDSIGRETDSEFRAREFLVFAREDLMKGAEYGASAVEIAKRLVSVPSLKSEAESLLAIAGVGDGKASFGAKMEYLTPRFVKQIAEPKMLVAMAAAPFVGVGLEFGALRGLGYLGKVGGAGRFTASMLGLGGEALAFTGMHRGLESAVHDPAKMTQGFWREVASTSLLFGSMRLAHGISGRFVNSMAEGKWGTLFGGKKSAEGLNFLTSPTGRIFADVSSAKALTNTGRFAAFLANHGGGIAGMYVAGAIARNRGLQPESKQGLGEHWLEAALSYGQATAGFNLANGLTGGRLQGSLGELKFRMSDLSETVPAPKSDKPAKRTTLKPRGSGATQFEFKAGDQSWSVQIDKIDRILFGRKLSAREGVMYEDREASVNFGDDHPDISQYHAVLTRDKGRGPFWYIGDTGSTFGTYVNGKKVGSGEHVLAKPDDLIQLGDTFQFRLHPDGALLEPATGVKVEVSIPIVRDQKRLDPPKIADQFPMHLLFPDSTVLPESGAEVAQIKSSRGKNILLRSDKTEWGFNLSKESSAFLRVFVDASGRWVLQKLDPLAKVEVARSNPGGEQRWVLEKLVKEEASQPGIGKGRQDWAFVEDGDQFYIQNQIFDFTVHSEPKVSISGNKGPMVLPRGGAIEVPIGKVGAALDPSVPFSEMPTAVRRLGIGVFPNPGGAEPVSSPPALPQASQEIPPPPPARDITKTLVSAGVEEVPPELDEGERPTLTGLQPFVVPAEARGGEVTQAGVPFPDGALPEFPPLLVTKIPEGQLPFVLSAGTLSIPADLTHTRYVLGSNPAVKKSNESTVKLHGHRIDENHAEIFLGMAEGATEARQEFQWYLTPHPDSEFGVFIDGYRKLEPNERVKLFPGRSFSLGDAAGERGGIQFNFEVPWLKKPSSPQELSPTSTKPASSFPKALLGNLAPDTPSMILRDNFRNWILSGNRETTRYVFGSLGARPVSGTTAFEVLPGDKIAPEHCEIFIDAKGEWYLRALSDTHPTYLRNKPISTGSVFALRSGDAIELGGNSKEGIGFSMIFDKPEYLPPREDSFAGAYRLPESAEGDFDTVGDDMLEGPDSSDDPVYELGPQDMKTQPPPKTPLPEGPVEPRPAAMGAPPPLPGKRPPPMPPPRRVGAALPPPLPVSGPAPEGGPKPASANELKTGVYPAFKRAELLARASLPDDSEAPLTVQAPAGYQAPPLPADAEPDPLAGWEQEFGGGPAAGSPKNTSVPPPNDQPAEIPAAPKVPVVPEAPEESFAGIAEEVLAQDTPAPVPGPGDPFETVRAEAPRQVVSIASADGDGFETVVAEVPRQVVPRTPSAATTVRPNGVGDPAGATPSTLTALHPSLTSDAILSSIQPLLVSQRSELSEALRALKAFPHVDASPSKAWQGSTEDRGQAVTFFEKLTGTNLHTGGGKVSPGAPISDNVKKELLKLVDYYWFSGKLKNVYDLESDGKNFRFSAFRDKDGPKPDTALTISVQPGKEVQTLRAIFEHFSKMGIPVEVVMPLTNEGMNAPAVAVFFQAKDFAEIRKAAIGLRDSHGGILDSRQTPFSQQLLDLEGRGIPGTAVMEHGNDSTSANILDRYGYLVARAYNGYNKVKQAQGAVVSPNGSIDDPETFRREILKMLFDNGFDLNHPGFRLESVEGSHKEVIEGSSSRSVAP
ncbi:MAG: FHA domain-containing protein [Deltaproteobacteria bacterium]|nr:FHA domain-containing protein [Deltaproteobacteria bacterium]